MMELLAGFIAGLSMSVVFTGLGAVMLFSSPEVWRAVSQRLPKGAFSLWISFVFALGSPVAWSVLGLAAGWAYRLVVSYWPGTGLGSPNLAFTLVACLTAVGGFGVPGLFFRRFRWGLFSTAVAFAASFGWLLPWLAQA